MSIKSIRSVGFKFLVGLLFLGVVASISTTTLADDVPESPQGFSNSGCSDLAIGVPNENLGTDAGKVDAGAINVIYGQRGSGLDYPGNHYWNLDTTGVGPLGEDGGSNEEFGNALTSGDFNGDGFADLAVGIHYRNIGTATDAGAVHVFYGASTGLTTLGDYMWHQGSPGMDGAVETGDYFGEALASGDFDGDGYDDLAIGVPLEDIGSGPIENAGLVHVMYGSSTGLNGDRDQLWTQDSDGVTEDAEEDDRFGSSLAAGDFDNDSYDDLAIGVPLESVGAVNNAGAVHIIYGSSSGLDAAGNTYWQQNSSAGLEEIFDSCEEDDLFGWSLAAGDFDGDSFDDLAIGVYNEGDGSNTGVGSVHVLFGADVFGISFPGDQYFWQSTLGYLNEQDDHFGEVLASGNFDADQYDDLVIGSPQEDLGTTGNAGVVYVLYGSASGPSTSNKDYWHQDVGLEGVAEEGDKFGFALAAGSFNCDAYDDLAIGAPGDDDVSGDGGAGVVNVLYSNANGLSVTGDQIWSQASQIPPDYIAGEGEAGDHFGTSLAAAPRWTNTIFLPIVKRN